MIRRLLRRLGLLKKPAPPAPDTHPYGRRCRHGVQFLNHCDQCFGGWENDTR